MQILWNEIKKMLTWKMLLLLAFVNTVLYLLLIEFHIEYFPNGRPALDSYNIGIEMIDKYGTDFDEEEFLDFKKTYENQLDQANEYLQSNKEFVDGDIESYQDFKEFDNEASNALRNKVFHEERVDIFWELQERERLIEFFEGKEKSLDAYKQNATDAQVAKFDELLEARHFQVYTEVVIQNYKEYIFNVAIVILLSIILMISPGILRDRTRQLIDLQYTAKKGRNLYKTKIMAGLITSFMMITVLLVVYMSIYSLNNTSKYFNIPVHMFIADHKWYDPTFFQYILLTILAIYILGIVTSLVAMSFSSIVPNFITLIGVQVPYVFVMLALGLGYLLNKIISMWLPQWIVPTSYGVLLMVSIISVVLLWKREKRRDIVL